MSRPGSRKMARLAFLLVTACLIALPPAWGGTIIDNFDDNSIDTSLWTIIQDPYITVQETGGRLRFTMAANLPSTELHGSAISSKFVLSGDFDMQVDYYLVTSPWPQDGGSRAGLVTSSATVERVSNLDGQFYYSLGVRNTTDDLSGKLRLTRTTTGGTTTTMGYYWTVIGWNKFSGSGSPSDIDTIAQLATWNDLWGGTQTVIEFDNFQVTGPNVVPLPSTLLLLGAGMVSLAAYRRRKLPSRN